MKLSCNSVSKSLCRNIYSRPAQCQHSATVYAFWGSASY